MEDDKIVALYWARSETAIAETSNKYGRYCKSIAFHILSDDEDADECVNDAYLGAWNAIPPGRPSRLAVFLGKITRNIALDRFDYKNAQKRQGDFDLILSELGDCLAGDPGVEAQLEEEETARVINDFLRSTGQESRHVFLRRYWNADSVAEIAARFQISESKVKSMLFRTRKRLKAHLEKEGLV